MIQVIKSDCIEFLKGPFAPFFDFMIGDPPFNIGQAYSDYDDNLFQSEYDDFTKQWIIAYWNKLKPGAAMMIHANTKVSRIFIRILFELNLEQYVENEICWGFGFGQCTFNDFIDTHTRAIVLRKPGQIRKWYVENVLTESKRLLMGDKRVLTSRYKGYIPFGTVWGLETCDGIVLEPIEGEPNWGRVQGNNKERVKGCPNQLPIRYPSRAILGYSQLGDTVFDGFCGSGSTAKACKLLSRHCITTDVSQWNVDELKRYLNAN